MSHGFFDEILMHEAKPSKSPQQVADILGWVISDVLLCSSSNSLEKAFTRIYTQISVCPCLRSMIKSEHLEPLKNCIEASSSMSSSNVVNPKRGIIWTFSALRSAIALQDILVRVLFPVKPCSKFDQEKQGIAATCSHSWRKYNKITEIAHC